MSGLHSGVDDLFDSAPSGANGPSSHATSRATSQVPQPDGEGLGQAPVQAKPKRRMVITHDKYVSLQSLIVLHLSQVERDTGTGMDKDELIDWYLELKEEEIQDVEELEYEKELITKMLRKLVKVRLSRSTAFLVRVLMMVPVDSRTTT